MYTANNRASKYRIKNGNWKEKYPNPQLFQTLKYLHNQQNSKNQGLRRPEYYCSVYLINKVFHPTTEYTFLSVHGTFTTD